MWFIIHFQTWVKHHVVVPWIWFPEQQLRGWIVQTGKYNLEGEETGILEEWNIIGGKYNLGET